MLRRPLPIGPRRSRDAPAAEAGAAAVPWGALLEGVAVIAGFSVFAVLMTWPLAAHFDTNILGGGSGGDPSGYVWDYWYNATHGLSLWGTVVQDVVSAPFGRLLPSSVNTTLFVSVAPAWVAAKVASPIAAYNVAALSGLVLSGSSMYLLVRWLRLGVGVAIWAGVSLVLFPYELLRVAHHVPLAHLEAIPVVVMAGVYWIERPGVRRAVLLALALAFAWLTNPYYGVACGILVAVFALWALVGLARRRARRGALARLGELAGAVTLLVIVPLLALFLSSRGAVEGVFTRDRIELELYGARLDDYVRPFGSNPIWHTVFGSPFQSPAGERLNYLGLATVVLALVGLGLALASRGGTGRGRLAALVAAPSAIVLIVVSLASPTRLAGAELTMPSSLIFDVMPFLRAFARFVAPVMVVALVAGAYGLWWLVRDRAQLWRMTILVAVLLVTAIELPSPLPIASARPVVVDGRPADEVPAWRWLRDRPAGEIAYEMPGLPNEAVERYFLYGQLVHEHPITNGGLFPGQIGHDFTAQAGAPQWPNSARWMSALGIDWVTIEPWAYAVAGKAPPDPSRPPAGYAVERIFPDGSAVWKVVAPPADGVPVFRDGWWPGEWVEGEGIWRWMGNEARITAVVPRPGAYRLELRARGSFRGATYRLRFDLPGGTSRVLPVRGDARRITLPLAMHDVRGDITLTNVGRAARQASPTDLRVVSVQFSEPELTRVGP
jgi:hypothetical protein